MNQLIHFTEVWITYVIFIIFLWCFCICYEARNLQSPFRKITLQSYSCCSKHVWHLILWNINERRSSIWFFWANESVDQVYKSPNNSFTSLIKLLFIIFFLSFLFSFFLSFCLSFFVPIHFGKEQPAHYSEFLFLCSLNERKFWKYIRFSFSLQFSYRDLTRCFKEMSVWSHAEVFLTTVYVNNLLQFLMPLWTH